MTGYFDKLNKWAAGCGQTYDEAAVSAYHLYQERRSY